MKEPNVCVIIVNFNGKEHIIECLESFKKIEYPDYHIVVVDNASTDGSKNLIKEKHPDITLIKNDENLGYGVACNIGIQWALKRYFAYVYLSNHDVICDRLLLSKLVEVGEDDIKNGIVMPIVYCYDRPKVVHTYGATINLWTGRQKLLDNAAEGETKLELHKKCNSVSGAGMLVRSEVFGVVGLFDPLYFMYTEEVDFADRLLREEYNIIAVSNAIIWHKVYGSLGGNKLPFHVYYRIRNRVYFMRKRIAPFSLLVFYSYILLYELPLSIYVFMKNGRLNFIKSYIKGVVDGLLRKMGVRF